jgi:hypothetical protein
LQNRPSSVPPIPGTQNGLAPWIQQQQQLQQQQQFYNPGYNNQQTLTQETGSTPSPHRSHALAPPKVAVFWDFENW